MRMVVPDHTEMTVAPDHPAQVAPAVIVIHGRLLDESASAEEFATRSEVRTTQTTLLGADHVLPAATRQEAVILAGDQFSSVLYFHGECWLD
jgi:hypothetical protein